MQERREMMLNNLADDKGEFGEGPKMGKKKSHKDDKGGFFSGLKQGFLNR
jgi:hypothetical protein